MITYGKEAGAAGVLNTDWGDCGQVNLLAASYHGLAFGADLSWNAECGGDDFDERFSFLQWGLGDGRLGKLLRELGGLSGYHFGNLYAWINNKQCLWYKEDDVKAMAPAELLRKAARAAEIESELAGIAREIDGDRLPLFGECLWSASATSWLLSLLLVKKKYEYGQDIDIPAAPRKIIEDGRALLGRFETLWRARNRESELRDVVETFEKIFSKIGEIAR
jgi:hypothetical protein